MSQKYYSQRESFPCLSVIKSKYRGEWGCVLYMRDVRWRLVKCTSLEHRVWLLWNWQFAGLIERSVLLFCDLSYSLNLRSWREKVDDVSGRGPGVKTVFMRDVRWEAWAHVTQGDTDFNWYELVTPAGAASRLMPHQSPIKTPLSLIHPALHVTLTVTSLLHDSPARHDKYVLIVFSYRVISSLDSLSLERRMVQFCARLLSITEMILCRRPMVPINLRSSIDPSTD